MVYVTGCLSPGGATRCHRSVSGAGGLCGALVSVGSVGTAYWTSGTALGTACTSRLEDQIAYLTCIRNPAGCTDLYAARPPPGSVCEPVTRSPSLSGWAGVGEGRRYLRNVGLTGTIPTNVVLLTSLTRM
jgi:hypothetical protein